MIRKDLEKKARITLQCSYCDFSQLPKWMANPIAHDQK